MPTIRTDAATSVKVAVYFALLIASHALGIKFEVNTALGSAFANQFLMLFLLLAITSPFFSMDVKSSLITVPRVATGLGLSLAFLFLLLTQVIANWLLHHHDVIPVVVEQHKILSEQQWAYDVGVSMLASPVLEEVAFRAVLLPTLIIFFGSAETLRSNTEMRWPTISRIVRWVAKCRVAIAIIVSSMLFAVSHTPTWYALVFQGSFGFFQAFAYLATGSLLFVIVIHITWNMLPYLLGYWGFANQHTQFESQTNTVAYLGLAILIPVTLICSFALFRKFRTKVAATDFSCDVD